jgi:hypothetical protein
MGAANDKVQGTTDDAASSKYLSSVLPAFGDCGSICGPTKSNNTQPDNGANGDTKNQNIRRGYKEGVGNRENSGANRSVNPAPNSAPERILRVQQANPVIAPPSFVPQISPRLQKVLQEQSQPTGFDGQPERSFKGTLPPDWARSQQDSLLLAVVDVSNHMKLRPPGPRAMQAVMAVRSGEQLDVTIPYVQG